MEESALSTPFGNEPLDEIHLSSAPLARVIAQLRFPQLASMADDTVAHTFAKAVSPEYPLLDEAREVSLVIAGSTISQQEQVTSPVWRLQTADGHWLVTLGRGSLSLESLSYPGRTEFCSRLSHLANAFIQKASPPRFDRFGIRYINRVTAPEIISNLTNMVRSEMLGAVAITHPAHVTVRHALMEAQFNEGPNSLLVRSGILPAGMTIDLAVPVSPLPSWILDIDAAISGADEVSLDKIRTLAVGLSERAYRFFRFAVNQEFLKTFE